MERQNGDFMKFDINKFLETGNNKLIVRIIDIIAIAILSVITLYYVILVLGTQTTLEYFSMVSKNLIYLFIFALADFLLIIFTKPLFGFTSVIDNAKARKALKAKEKATKKAIEENAKATLAAAKAARKAEQARNK